MKNKKVLNLEKRREIYNYILRFPGVHLSKLFKDLKMQKNNVCYHLDVLQKNGLIETTFNDGYLRYYPVKLQRNEAEMIANLFAKIYPYEEKTRILEIFKYYIPGKNERKILDLIKRPIPQEIMRLLAVDNNLTLTDISKRINKHWTTVSFHLKKLIKLDVVERVSEGNKTTYKIKDYEEHLIRFSCLFDAWREQVNRDRKKEYVVELSSFDSVIDAFFEICPNPYHV